MSAGNMSIRTSLKRAARDFFDSDDTFMDMDALSEDVSEDDSVASYQDQIMATDYNDRMLSPKSAMDMPIMLGASPTKKSRDDSHLEKRVTIWNWREQRKLSGNSAPFKKNLQEYLRKHPDWEEYTGQDKDENGKKSFAPKKRRKETKSVVDTKPDGVRRSVPPHRAAGMLSMESVLACEPRRKVSVEIGISAQKELAQRRHAKNELAAKQKDQEEKEASRWREFSAIQHIIDHYSQGPAKSPFVGDNAMMNA